MALVGNLKDLKLPNLIQINCMERNTAKLTIEHAGKYAFVYFQAGQIAHAEYDPYIGEEAIMKMLSLQEGKFKVEGDVRPPAVTIKTHWNNLLLEGLHQLDDRDSSESGQYTRAIEMLMSVRGVQRAAIFTQTGEVVAATFEVEKEAILNALAYFEIQRIPSFLNLPSPEFVSLIEHQTRILLTRYEDYLAYIEVEAKFQVETLLPFLVKALG
jgi:hypothetical protein